MLVADFRGDVERVEWDGRHGWTVICIPREPGGAGTSSGVLEEADKDGGMVKSKPSFSLRREDNLCVVFSLGWLDATI